MPYMYELYVFPTGSARMPCRYLLVLQAWQALRCGDPLIRSHFRQFCGSLQLTEPYAEGQKSQF